MRIRLTDIAILFTICAFFFACLARRTWAAEIACCTCTSVFIIGSIPFAVGKSGSKRAFWIAFYCVSSVYAASSDIEVMYASPWSSREYLVTDRLIEQVESSLPFPVESSRDVVNVRNGQTEFYNCGHAFLAITFGWMAGHVASIVFTRCSAPSDNS